MFKPVFLNTKEAVFLSRNKKGHGMLQSGVIQGPWEGKVQQIQIFSDEEKKKYCAQKKFVLLCASQNQPSLYHSCKKKEKIRHQHPF